MKFSQSLKISTIFVLVFFSGASFAQCDFNSSLYLDELSTLESIEKIEIKFSNGGNWIREGFRLKEKPKTTKKKTHQALLTVHYPFGRCTYPAKIRASGDLGDHHSLVNGIPFHSLDVKLKAGNLAHITHFKFFLPRARRKGNEIIITELLKNLGFLAPTTRFIPVIQHHNQAQGLMLVQTKVSKEMLEKNNRREGAIFEGDEDFIWNYRYNGHYHNNKYYFYKISLGRLVNRKWANAGNHSAYISAFGINGLQYANIVRKNYIFSLSTDFQPELRAKNFLHYDMAMFSFIGWHGLVINNRKFFFNSITQKLEPIYYDGATGFGPVDYGKKARYNFHKGNLYHPLLKIISQSDISHLITKIDAVIDSDFSTRVGALVAADNKDKAYIDKVLGDVKANLLKLAARKRKLNPTNNTPPKLTQAQIKAVYKKRLFKKLEDAQTIELKNIDFQKSLFHIERCYINHCSRETLNRQEFTKILQSKEIKKDSDPAIIYIGADESFAKLLPKKQSFVAGLNLTLTHSPKAKVIFDQSTRTLTLIQSRYDDWFLLKNGSLKNIKIELKGKLPNRKQIKILEKSQRFNRHGLTGCVSFYQMDFNNVELSAKSGGCEDSINILNSTGTIKKISISDAYADALDIDFSNLTLSNLAIKRAGNDCVDVSAGKYQIARGIFKNCGDKAISVGEASKLKAANINIESANIGISSKDSSNAEIDKFQAKNTKICGEAFNKKQEFFGAVLEIAHPQCKGKYSADKNSTIFIDGKKS